MAWQAKPTKPAAPKRVRVFAYGQLKPWKEGAREATNLFKKDPGPQQFSSDFVHAEDGRTTDPRAAMAKRAEFWNAIWHGSKEEAEGVGEQLASIRAVARIAQEACPLPKITAADVRRALKVMAPRRGRGCDRWFPLHLLALPEQALHDLAQIYNDCETCMALHACAGAVQSHRLVGQTNRRRSTHCSHDPVLCPLDPHTPGISHDMGKGAIRVLG